MAKNNNCTTVRRFTTIRSIQEFAALWCGASENELHIVLKKSYGVAGSTAMGSLIVRNDDFPCLEARIRFIIDAINENRVECCDETGNFRGNENIAWSRKCLRLDKAKAWLENSALPRHELPEFLFQNSADNIPQTPEGLAEAQKRIKELEEIIGEKDKRIEELERMTIDYDKSSPVNAERWRHSCRCLAKTFAAYIINPMRDGITKKDFLDFMKNRVEGFSNPLVVVEEIAWQEFPQSLKNGVGRPSYNRDMEDLDVPF